MTHSDHCPFCTVSRHNIVAENTHSYAIYDKFPVQQGHMLFIPKRHVETFFDASPEETASIFELMRECKAMLDETYHPDGYNIGVNVGVYGGQTIPHLHVHLIPRYKGDVPDPRGGVRNIVPNLVPYPPKES
jgi:diadenosine tetraphosphate (Ap4A) HIT family hydrolase